MRDHQAGPGPHGIAVENARSGAGLEALKRGKSLLARLPAWEGRFPRVPAEMPVRGIQPGRCCQCGKPGRKVEFRNLALAANEDAKVPRVMDWCGKGKCKEGTALPAMPGPVAVRWAWEGAWWLAD